MKDGLIRKHAENNQPYHLQTSRAFIAINNFISHLLEARLSADAVDMEMDVAKMLPEEIP